MLLRGMHLLFCPDISNGSPKEHSPVFTRFFFTVCNIIPQRPDVLVNELRQKLNGGNYVLAATMGTNSQSCQTKLSPMQPQSVPWTVFLRPSINLHLAANVTIREISMDHRMLSK